MLKKNQENKINSTDPWKDDVLDLKHFSEKLTDIISTITQPFTIALDGSYGSGKTFFMKRWQKDLENKTFKTFYFNAWKTDFTEDPLFAFFSEFEKEIKPSLSKARSALSASAKGIIQSTGKTLSESIELAIKVKSLGTVNISPEKVIKDFQSNLQESQEIITSIKKDNYSKLKKNINDFKKHLSSNTEQQRIVIFIDDLDRCRPTYAVELLEMIKHLFDVDGVIFILGVDTEQLQHSVKSIYGTDMNSSGYLRKFIDWTTNIPTPSHENFAEFLFKKFGLDEVLNVIELQKDELAGRDTFLSAFATYSNVFNLSLRDQERLFTELNVVIRSRKSSNYIFYPPVTCLLMILKIKEKELYDTLLKETDMNTSEYIHKKLLSSNLSFINSRIWQENTKMWLFFAKKRLDEIQNEINRTKEHLDILDSPQKSSYSIQERQSYQTKINILQSIKREIQLTKKNFLESIDDMINLHQPYSQHPTSHA